MTHLSEHTVFSLLKDPKTKAPSRQAWIWLGILTIAAWIASVAFIGRYRRHQVTAIFETFASLEMVYLAGAILAAGVFAYALIARRRGLALAAGIIVAFILGHHLYAWIYRLLPARFDIPFRTTADAAAFSVARIAYLLGVGLPMLAIWFCFARRGDFPGLRLGWGNFQAAGRDFSRKAPMLPWGRQFRGGYGIFCLIFFVIMQGNVLFRPILSGNLWPLLPGILLAATANALAEEYIFRGLIQPAFIRAGGVAAGLWLQGLLFGLMHWGVSVGLLAALPVSLLIGLGSVVWGKAALETGGMGWVIIAHAMIDIAIMSAFFVGR